MPGGAAQEFTVDGQAVSAAGQGTIRRQLLNRLPDFAGTGGGGHGGTESDAHGVGELLRPLPEKAPALVAENAAPDMVEADRDNRCRRPFDDLLEAPMK